MIVAAGAPWAPIFADRHCAIAFFLTKDYCCILSKKRGVPMPPTRSRPVPAAAGAAVLTKATLRAVAQLGLTSKALSAVIGLSEATVSRMRSGDYTLQPGQKSFEPAVAARVPRSA
jgi:Antitoxin Xre-like helix-turn-helix domain